MSLADITQDAVLKAIVEYDELGQDIFLDTYGFEPSHSYKLLHEGKEYDSKAICGVAHKYAHGDLLPASKFSGGAATVAKKLQKLGFEVKSTRNPNWAWDELVLACDLVARNGWKGIDATKPEVINLSELLQHLPLHPESERAPTFRNPNGVGRKTHDIATAHPDHTGARTNGGQLDREVLQAFLEDPERMHAAAKGIREGVLSGELAELSAFEEEEPDEEISAPEGRLLIRKHYARERNRKLRMQKIDQTRAQGLPIACEACGFDFGRTYGARGSNYIEVHHIVPLHHIGESRTRLQDLALMCANCHRMIHVSKPWLTVEQLRTLIEKQRQFQE
ncbi:5-methylcytosine-specific restriction protein A [Nocardiopsis arvandica]|uniref:5-methylcytosine-specific restriction protein A n=1 Tax=Nocardiopsis sinuspersici TaxID=501010 RepID=A0A7Y9XB79_9ACTN|nr:HNH endonuclease [Nocardiopsis sinuspersici]NYH52601.1 5-methylcytosine-specific restriction protein A [Nocardiopsis sinuspersici]